MRPDSSMINDKNYYEFMVDIGDDAIKRIISSLADIYTARFNPVPELNRLAYNIMSVSMFFDTRYSTLYITYNLDKERNYALGDVDEKIYKKVNKTIDTIQRDYDIVVNIVGDPIRLPQFGHDYPIMGTTDMSDYGKIEVATEFLWNIIPGPYDITYPFFIQNKARLEDNIRKNNLSPEKVQEYFNKVIEINKTYINDSETPDYVKAFKKYITLNKKTFGYAPKIVEEWRQFTIYIDVTHNFKEENYNSPDHDRGYLDNAGRIREYIIDWAKKHHKRY